MAAAVKKETDGSMPLTGHLRELRNRLLVCVVPFVGLTVAFIPGADRLMAILTDMGERFGYRYVYLAPQELLIEYLRIAVLGAFLCCVPLILFQVWSFARPGLERGEKQMFAFSMLFGLLCFCLGILFAYRITVPFMLQFLIGLSSQTVSAAISIEKYTSFLLTVFLIFGIIFELPMVSIILTNLGFIDSELLKRFRKLAIVVSFVVAAFITPPDIFSQVMVSVPIVLLYQVSIWLSAVVGRMQKGKKEEA
jgi:sec-independent protein translocase protein TatC